MARCCWLMPIHRDLALAALRTALRTREIGPGLVHHSDRGVQYASGDYTKLLQQHGISISMSRKANPIPTTTPWRNRS